MLDFSKIKTQEEIVPIVELLKQQGKKVVAFNGAFDVLHCGHLGSLFKAKDCGDALIILLNSDESIRSYKGPTRPIVSESERAKMLVALSCVDYIVSFDEINPKRVLDKIKPDILCKGDDWGKDCIEKEVMEKNGGEIIILEKEYATTDLIKLIAESVSRPIKKALFFDFDLIANEIKEDSAANESFLNELERLNNIVQEIFIFINQFDAGSEFDNKIQKLEERLKEKNVLINFIYFSSIGLGHSDIGNEELLIPLFVETARKFGISLNNSWIISEKEIFVKISREINSKAIKLGDKMQKFKVEPYYYSDNLAGSINIILNH